MSAPSKEDWKLVYGSRVYTEFLAERDEIMRHKWLQSEKLGEDIGFEKALMEWMRLHRSRWVESRREQRDEGREN